MFVIGRYDHGQRYKLFAGIIKESIFKVSAQLANTTDCRCEQNHSLRFASRPSCLGRARQHITNFHVRFPTLRGIGAPMAQQPESKPAGGHQNENQTDNPEKYSAIAVCSHLTASPAGGDLCQ
jgi:hypothetical protein